MKISLLLISLLALISCGGSEAPAPVWSGDSDAPETLPVPDLSNEWCETEMASLVSEFGIPDMIGRYEDPENPYLHVEYWTYKFPDGDGTVRFVWDESVGGCAVEMV